MSQKVGVLDVTSADFDVDAYLSSQLKEKNLDELVKEEEEMVSSVRRLDSDVHQLVYENYNKFLTATSTVRKIQDEFNLLDSEMESLSRNMKNISALIGELSGVLGGGREGVAQLGSSYKVVKSLQSIFELPNILQASFDEGKYNDVVRVYLLAQKGLSKYSDIKNIAEIQKKIDQIIAETEKQSQLADFHEIVSKLFLASSDPKDCSIVVRALDRYYRKMSTCKQVVQGVAEVTTMLKTCSQALLRRFAKFRGLELGEALVKGCEGLRQPAASPVGVRHFLFRSAVRRAVEEVLECDSLLSRLLGGETGRKENRHRRATPAPSAADSSRDSLWCERIDFNQQLHFNRASIIGAIVKVLLKSFIESIRLQTYGKFAVEQIQVDCYYLQRGVSPLVADEVIVNSMVDQALSSALKRCVAPELVHPTRLRQICEDKTE
ncbi:Vps51/Vps67 protein [Teladorsagia circumcincta]|uniref:Vacuolar protein sorting-associated protein 51 homolog n=3 Tax=Teladorsagia circumcincta TaxID=45464 RepID=A0A2G9UCA6_TELCI|nr:Vps51/Vps67 protein [Teladorsagia circumcincta]